MIELLLICSLRPNTWKHETIAFPNWDCYCFELNLSKWETTRIWENRNIQCKAAKTWWNDWTFFRGSDWTTPRQGVTLFVPYLWRHTLTALLFNWPDPNCVRSTSWDWLHAVVVLRKALFALRILSPLNCISLTRLSTPQVMKPAKAGEQLEDKWILSELLIAGYEHAFLSSHDISTLSLDWSRGTLWKKCV